MKVTVLKRFMYKNKSRIEGEIVEIDDASIAQSLIRNEYALACTDNKQADVKQAKNEAKQDGN